MRNKPSNIASIKERLQKSAKKQKSSIRSRVSSTSMSIKQRLSSVKKKKRPASRMHIEQLNQGKQPESKRRRRTATTGHHNNGKILRREHDSVRAANAIENGIPERRRKERQQRIQIVATGDMQVAEDHLKFGRHQQAKHVLDSMSPETVVVAKTCAQYWVQRIQASNTIYYIRPLMII